jgi:hypothetical protein
MFPKYIDEIVECLIDPLLLHYQIPETVLQNDFSFRSSASFLCRSQVEIGLRPNTILPIHIFAIM